MIYAPVSFHHLFWHLLNPRRSSLRATLLAAGAQEWPWFTVPAFRSRGVVPQGQLQNQRRRQNFGLWLAFSVTAGMPIEYPNTVSGEL